MSALIQQAALAADTGFQSRVRMAILLQAQAVAAAAIPGGADLASYALSTALAADVFSGGGAAQAPKFAYAIAGSPAISAGFGANLITNPDFTAGTTGWNTSASFLTATGSTLTQDISDSADGTGTCGQVVTTNSAYYEGIWYSVTGLAPSTSYAFSVYLKLTSGSQPLSIICYDSTNGITAAPASTPTPCPPFWTQYSCAIATGASGPVTARIAVRGNLAAVSTFLVSGAFFATSLGTAIPVAATQPGPPAVITTTAPHGLVTGNTVKVVNTLDTAVAGTWYATVIDSLDFSVPVAGMSAQGNGGQVMQQPSDSAIALAVATVWPAMAGVNAGT